MVFKLDGLIKEFPEKTERFLIYIMWLSHAVFWVASLLIAVGPEPVTYGEKLRNVTLLSLPLYGISVISLVFAIRLKKHSIEQNHDFKTHVGKSLLLSHAALDPFSLLFIIILLDTTICSYENKFDLDRMSILLISLAIFAIYATMYVVYYTILTTLMDKRSTSTSVIDSEEVELLGGY